MKPISQISVILKIDPDAYPAWCEAIRSAFDKLIQRMLQKPVWQYWANESKGIIKFEPDKDRPYPAMKDPVTLGNIMYSGLLWQMITLYQMLYNDRKWDQSDSNGMVTLANTSGGNRSVRIINLSPAKYYTVTIDKVQQQGVINQENYTITFDVGKAHDIIVVEK